MEPDAFPDRIFVTGTDTGMGKTLVCGVLLAGLKCSYWKPVQSGLEDGTDSKWLKSVTGLPDGHFHRERYRLTQPLSPHLAAPKDGMHINLQDFLAPEPLQGPLLIEGAGGILVPLNEQHYMTDLARHLQASVLVVARSTLGTINHTLLTIRELRRAGLSLLGVIMNGPPNAENREAIEYYGQVQVLAEIPKLQSVDAVHLQQCFRQQFREQN